MPRSQPETIPDPVPAPRQHQGRLFVGIAVPAETAARLAAVAPRPGRGIRPVAPADMHVTLRFIGQADVASAVAALGAVTAPRFELHLRGAGTFSRRGRVHAVWAGVEAGEGLLQLHDAVGAALGAAGFAQEARPYRPHVTLARFGRALGSGSGGLEPAAVPAEVLAVDRFTLYQSGAPQGSGGRYTPRLIVVLD